VTYKNRQFMTYNISCIDTKLDVRKCIDVKNVFCVSYFFKENTRF